jgi:Ni/Co efflux regulator RcnB
MRKLICLAALAAIALPATAIAHDRDDDYRGRRGHHDEWREHHRHDWKYRGWRPYQHRFAYNDYYRNELPRPRWDERWINDHGDAVLIDLDNGRVLRVVRGYYRD